VPDTERGPAACGLPIATGGAPVCKSQPPPLAGSMGRRTWLQSSHLATQQYSAGRTRWRRGPTTNLRSLRSVISTGPQPHPVRKLDCTPHDRRHHQPTPHTNLTSVATPFVTAGRSTLHVQRRGRGARKATPHAQTSAQLHPHGSGRTEPRTCASHPMNLRAAGPAAGTTQHRPAPTSPAQPICVPTTSPPPPSYPHVTDPASHQFLSPSHC